MLPSLAFAAYYCEGRALFGLLLSMIMCGVVGGVLVRIGRNAPDRFYQREALGLVGMAWLLVSGLGALPFLFSGVLSPVDAIFESASGFTTTGASVFGESHFRSVPNGILFWRSFTHWIGGMGIIVLFLAVLPYLGAGGKQVFKSEAPGPDPRALKPRIRDTATVLYTIYLGFTVLETGALMIAGLGFFEALCHTFGTLATGGFSTRPASVGEFQNVWVEIIVIVFMICAGTNFALHYGMLRGDWKALFRDTEWRAYITILLIVVLLVAINLMGWGVQTPSQGARPVKLYHSFTEALRYAAFQVVSIMTTTGFCTDDFDRWPDFSRMMLLALMFVGGCAGSTGGGMKVIRVLILAKMAYWRLEKSFRPRTVRAVRIGGHPVDEAVQQTVYAFFALHLFWTVSGSLFMAYLGLPFMSALGAVAATLNNIGPGLEAVGASMNYSAVPCLGKVFLTVSMVLGRLELFSVLVLFVPAFWKRE